MRIGGRLATPRDTATEYSSFRPGTSERESNRMLNRDYGPLRIMWRGVVGGGSSSKPESEGGIGDDPSSALEQIGPLTIATTLTGNINLGPWKKVFFNYSIDFDDGVTRNNVEVGSGVAFRNLAGTAQIPRLSYDVAGDGSAMVNAGWAITGGGANLELAITNNESDDIVVTLTITGRQ